MCSKAEAISEETHAWDVIKNDFKVTVLNMLKFKENTKNKIRKNDMSIKTILTRRYKLFKELEPKNAITKLKISLTEWTDRKKNQQMRRQIIWNHHV